MFPQINAKKRAERKYEKALKSAGISEDFLKQKGRSGTTMTRSRNGGDGDDSKSEASYDYHYDDDDFGRQSSNADDDKESYDDDSPRSD